MGAWLYVCRWTGIFTALIGTSTACTTPPDAPPPLSEMPAAVAAEVALDLRPIWPRTEFQLEITKKNIRYFSGSHSSVSNRIVADVIIEPTLEGGTNLSWAFGMSDYPERSGYSRGGFSGGYTDGGSDWRLRNTSLRIQLDTNGMPKSWIEVETPERFPALRSGPAAREEVYALAPHPFLFLGLAGSSVSGGAAHPFRSAWKGWPPIWKDSLVRLEEFDREQNTATITVQRIPDPKPMRELIMELWERPGASHRSILRPKDEITRLNFQTRATYRIDLKTGLPEHVVFDDIVTLDGKLDRFFRIEFRVLGRK